MYKLDDDGDQEVDHRFSSEEGSVVHNIDSEGDKEEVKNISSEVTPNKFNKPLIKMATKGPYDNKAFEQVQRIEERKSESNEKQSEIDKIHAFMDECKEELKSMDQTLKRDRLSMDFQNCK